MVQDVLRILHPFAHLLVFCFQSCGQRVSCSLPFFVCVGDPFRQGAEENFSFIFKVNLDNFVRKSEHFCMASFDPFFDIHSLFVVFVFNFFFLKVLIQILLEMC